jgi:hypothetical protein
VDERFGLSAFFCVIVKNRDLQSICNEFTMRRQMRFLPFGLWLAGGVNRHPQMKNARALPPGAEKRD